MATPERGDRSIRNIPVSSHHRASSQGIKPPQQDYDDSENDEAGLPPPHLSKLPHRRSGFSWWLMGGVVVVCAIAGLLLSIVFEGAKVTITPKEFSVPIPQTIQALPNAPVGSLAYTTMTLTQSATTTVKESGTEHVSHTATGIATLYNNFSTASQTLISNTRLESTDGKIYRIQSTVSIPGATKNADGSLEQGSIDVPITADKPGAEYNQDAPIKLTIPGFKGLPKYTKLLAISKGTLSGGLVGDEPSISTADMTSAQDELKRQLDTAMQTASAGVPEDNLPVISSLGTTYAEIQKTPGDGNSVTLSQSASATMGLIKVTDLANALAKKTATDYKGEPVTLKDPSAVTLSLNTAGGAKVTGTLSLTVGGTPTLVWVIDSSALKDALVGKRESEFQSLIKPFGPAIDKAKASIRPLWKTTFPTDPAKITVEINP